MSKKTDEVGFESAPPIKPCINVGACLDIPTGTFYMGTHGESILNGGLSPINGIVGQGNNFKTTIAEGMILIAMDRINQTTEPKTVVYDSEVNKVQSRVNELAQAFTSFVGTDIIDTKKWLITDSTILDGGEFHDKWRATMRAKTKRHTLPFTSKSGEVYKMYNPTFTLLDSLSEFKSLREQNIMDETQLGDSKFNTYYMRAGQTKARLLQEIPTLANKFGDFFFMTAQVGKKIDMNTNPHAAPPPKKLAYMLGDFEIKGATDKFLYATHSCYFVSNQRPLLDKDKMPEYPIKGQAVNSRDTDLVSVEARQLRSKFGTSGYDITLILSQREGIQQAPTEFHMLRTKTKLWGFTGNDTKYQTAFTPDVTMNRKSVRDILNDDEKVARAVNILSEFHQMRIFMPSLAWMIAEPTKIYEILKSKGYEWDTLLRTRGWWCMDNELHPVPFLSSLDILNMAVGKYHPYWLEKDNKTVVKKVKERWDKYTAEIQSKKDVIEKARQEMLKLQAELAAIGGTAAAEGSISTSDDEDDDTDSIVTGFF